MLNIHLLGPLQLEIDGQLVGTFRSSKALALFIYLAHTGQPHPRELLADLLWDSNSTRQALSNLRTVLTQLRPKLGDYILSEGSTLAFDPAQPHRLDTAVLQTELAAIPNTLTPITAARLETALQAVRGDFLEDFVVRHAPRFDEWALIERERLRRHVLTASQQLAQYFLTQSDFPAAIRAATRWLALDALDESAHRLLMQALALSGQRSAALQQYDACVALLHEELGVPPAETTEALAAQIRAGELNAPQAASRATAPAAAAPQTIAVPAKTAVPHNLQFTPFTFCGRAAEQADALAALQDPTTRLLTLTGAGGMGKTRLATVTAVHAITSLTGQFRDGVYFLPLAALETPNDILTSLAAALELRLQSADVQPLADQLSSYLRERLLLLVLDNVEHLLGSGVRALIQTLLSSAPGLTLLATSREPLELDGETVHQLDGFTLPPETAVALNAPAAHLFQQAARRVQPTFTLTPADAPALRRLCRWLMGLPLALELAGAWADTLSLGEMVAEIEQNVDFLEALRADVPDRQRSLRAVFDATWQRLATAEQALWPQLALFRDGFTFAAAHHALGASRPLLARLVKKSLLQFDRQQERYSLHSLLQQFGQEKLADGAAAAARDGLADYYCRWLQERLPALHGGAQQETAVAISADWQNIRRAWLHAAERQRIDWLETAVQPLNHFSIWRGASTETIPLLQTACHAAAGVETAAALRLQVMLLGWQALHYEDLGRLDRHRALLAEAEAALNHPALPPAEARFARAFLRREQGKQWRKSDPDRAEAAYAESRQLFHDLGEMWQESVTLAWLGDIMSRRHDWRRLADVVQQMLALQEQMGDRRGMAYSLLRLSALAQRQLKLDEAEKLARRALHITQALAETALVNMALYQLGTVFLRGGRFAAAEAALQESYTLTAEGTGVHVLTKDNLHMLGFSALWQQDFARAERFYRQALAVGEQNGDAATIADSLGFLGLMHLLAGRVGAAQQMLAQAMDSGERMESRNRQRWANRLGLAHLHAGMYAQAAELAAIAPAHIEAGPLQVGLLAVDERPLSTRQTLLQEQAAAFQQRGNRPNFPDQAETLGMAAISAAHLRLPEPGWTWAYLALQEAVETRLWPSLLYGLCAIARLHVLDEELEEAATLLALVETFPLVTASRWFEEVVRRPVKTAVQALPPARRAVLRARGQREDVWQTAVALLEREVT